jgi:UPF0271 protein
MVVAVALSWECVATWNVESVVPRMHTIDLNADLGEGALSAHGAEENAILAHVSSANIACGFHAGDPSTIAYAIERCASLQVAIGAHPSYPDRSGFGRRFLDATPDEVYRDMLYQIGAIDAFCRASGVKLRHVKPHGALYNHAAVDSETAAAIARAVHDFNPDLALFAPPASMLLAAAKDIGLPAVAEIFADRAVHADGSLVSRRLAGAVLHDPEQVARRAVRMVLEGKVTSIDGVEVSLGGDTLCLHGDAPGSAARAAGLRMALEAAGIDVHAPSRFQPHGA